MKEQSILPFLIAILAAQDQLEEFSHQITDSILSLPLVTSRVSTQAYLILYHRGCPDALTDTLKWAGSEKLVLALLPSMAKR